MKALLIDLIEAGYTQRRIAEESGVDQSTISRVLSDRRGSRLSYDTVRAVEKVHANAIKASQKRRPARAKAA